MPTIYRVGFPPNKQRRNGSRHGDHPRKKGLQSLLWFHFLPPWWLSKRICLIRKETDRQTCLYCPCHVIEFKSPQTSSALVGLVVRATNISPAGFGSSSRQQQHYTALCSSKSTDWVKRILPLLKMAAVSISYFFFQREAQRKRAVIVLSSCNWLGLFLPCRVSPWCARRHPPLQGSCPSGDRHGIVTRCGVVKPCLVLWLARSCNNKRKMSIKYRKNNIIKFSDKSPGTTHDLVKREFN